MKPFRRCGEATAPDGTVLGLFEHDGAYVIRVNGVELMSTRRHRSEDALAELACASLGDRPGATVLIGGLGLGFTLKAALPLLAPDAHVVVVEIMSAVIDWNRNPEYRLAAGALADARVEVVHGDVADVLRERRAAFDVILLDVDNGAEALTTSGNAALYEAEGIRSAIAALRPGGLLAYWSANDDRAFATALRREGLDVAITPVRAHARGGPRHALLFGRRR